MSCNPIYDTDTLEQIEHYAGLFLTKREIAVLLNINPKEFLEHLEDENTPVYLAYLRGKTLAKQEIREKVVTLARQGSPQAQTLAEQYIQQQEIDDLNE
jgi:hypothetical protein